MALNVNVYIDICQLCVNVYTDMTHSAVNIYIDKFAVSEEVSGT